MRPTITWLDLTSRDRDQVQKLISLFDEKGTLDEMGIGPIRDAFSNCLFPGVNTLQTHLRYVLFIPWIYRRLETKRHDPSTLPDTLREEELGLIRPLALTTEQGVIGIRSGSSIRQLPSNIYWNCLTQWGIFLKSGSQSWFHSNFHRLRETAREASQRSRHDSDDPITSFQIWHPKIPPAPQDFPRVASFDLSTEEASFIQEQIKINCQGSLLAHIAAAPFKKLPESFWEVPVCEKNNPLVFEAVENARRFSLFAQSMTLLYRLMLAQLIEKEFKESFIGQIGSDAFTQPLKKWAAEWAKENSNFDPNILWGFLARIGYRPSIPTKNFINGWANQLAKIEPHEIGSDKVMRDLVHERECRLKGPKRARLANQDKRRDWFEPTGSGRLDFNWYKAKVHLQELYEGLNQC